MFWKLKETLAVPMFSDGQQLLEESQLLIELHQRYDRQPEQVRFVIHGEKTIIEFHNGQRVYTVDVYSFVGKRIA